MSTTRELTMPDGRTVGVAEFGPANGRPVLAFHGIPGTRLMFRVADAVTHRHGLRLIAPDRPGLGRSTPKLGRTLQDGVADMAALADRLELDRFATFGISGGAAYAVATAAAMPNRVAALALASPMGPVRDLHGDIEISLAHKAFFMWLAGQHLSARALAATAASGFHMAPGWLYDGFVATLPPSDRDVLSRPALKNLIIEDVHEALRSGSSGGVADLEVFTRPWNVAFADARMPARVWQGTADTIVPPEAAFGLARLLPGATLEVIEDGGHFWIYEGFDDVLAWIADAWQDGELRRHAQDAALEPARP